MANIDDLKIGIEFKNCNKCQCKKDDDREGLSNLRIISEGHGCKFFVGDVELKGVIEANMEKNDIDNKLVIIELRIGGVKLG